MPRRREGAEGLGERVAGELLPGEFAVDTVREGEIFLMTSLPTFLSLFAHV